MTWLFGYGSLLWNQGFGFVERHPARLDGFVRRFWQGSTDHRGVPGAPGRVVTLVPEEGGSTWGEVFLVRDGLDAVLTGLDHREKGGYRRRSVKVELRDGRRLEALTYLADASNPEYLGPASLLAMVAQIRAARGPSGPNPEYLLRLAEALGTLGVRDPHVEELVQALTASSSRIVGPRVESGKDHGMDDRIPRRTFLTVVAAGVAAAGCGSSEPRPPPTEAPHESASDAQWSEVRGEFALDPEKVHLGALYIASHPRPVREAIETHRRNLDRDPVGYLNSTNRAALQDVREAGAGYLGVAPDELALTESTTMGVGLVYNGMRLEEGDEIVACADDYYVTEESLRLAAERSGAVRRTVRLYDDPGTLSPEEIVDRLMSQVGPRTRVMAVTWVHSGTGLKLPLARIAEALADANGGRSDEERVLLCVDGVHGFGVEKELLPELGVDFFMAGCHKWLFGPRGTGIVWAPRRNWSRVQPTIPSFTADAEWFSWLAGGRDPGPATARSMSPGGFKAFEHRWALAEAFRFRERIGRERVAERTHALGRRCKAGLAAIPGVQVVTPMTSELSSGIICFGVDGADPSGVVSGLDERGVVATVTPYARVLVRFGPSVLNTEGEIDQAVRAVADLA